MIPSVSPTLRWPPNSAAPPSPMTLRGSGHHNGPQIHLLAVMDHTTRAILAQTDVDHTTNEIARFRPLLDHLDLPPPWSLPMRSTPNASMPTGWSPKSTPPTC
jgi:hypothetical protein